MPDATIPGPRPSLFASASFRWLFAGSAVSMVGDQFTLIALPWLVLQLTGDPLALGGALALIALPRAAFILVGGALVDRLSPRNVLMATKFASAVLLATLAVLDGTGALRLWMADLLALALGVVTAFSYPAGSAMLPATVERAALPAANSLIMVLRQVTMLAGPAVAGGVIAAFGTGADAARHGIAVAFAVDAASFLVSAAALMRVRTRAASAPAHQRASSVAADIVEGLHAFWRDAELRTLCLYFAAIGLLVGGPIQVALPVLASRQLPGGAASLGLLMAGQGLGLLVGMAGAGWRPRWRLGTLGATMLAIDALDGLAFVPFGHISATWQGVALLALVGALGGFVQVALLTWIQRRVAPAMLGRTMSLFMFLILGLSPVAAAAAGAVLHFVSPATLFLGCGTLLVAIAALGFWLTPIGRIRDAEAAPSAV